MSASPSDLAPVRSTNVSDISARRLSSHLPSKTRSTSIETPVGNLTASATALTTTKIRRMRGATPVSTSEWMRLAWHYFETTGELHYASEYEANSVSRSRLFAARLPDKPGADPEPIEDLDHPARAAVDSFLGGRTQQPISMARIDNHLFVTGLSHIVMWDEDGRQRWEVLSNEELSWAGNSWRIRVDGEDIFRSTDDTVVIRVWNPSPRKHWEPTSAIRSLLPVLGELEGLTKHVSATIDSRLAGAGLLVLPQEMDFPADPDTPPDVDPFMYALTKAMSAPISNRDIAAALVPFAIKVPGEMVDKIQHITFFSDLDEQAKGLRDEAIRRLSLGLSIPPEILLGLAQATQSSAWQVEESTIKIHIEPRLQTICHAGTVGYLQPYLKASGIEDWDRYVIWYDVTKLKLRPNRSNDAKDLHDNILISDESRRKAAGFDEADAPDEEQFKDQLIRRVITSQPQTGLNLLPLLGIDPVPIPGTALAPEDTAVDHDQDPSTAPVQPSGEGAEGEVRATDGEGTGISNQVKGRDKTTAPIVDPDKDPVEANKRRGSNRPPA